MKQKPLTLAPAITSRREGPHDGFPLYGITANTGQKEKEPMTNESAIHELSENELARVHGGWAVLVSLLSGLSGSTSTAQPSTDGASTGARHKNEIE
jgi:hypothetical protein